MAVTQSINGAVIKATAEGDVIPGRYFKALFWVLSAATENTHLLKLTEGRTAGGAEIYADAAPKTHGAVAIPCPEEAVEQIYITDLDNGYILAYPKSSG